ncbi:MAG: tetratricopeptide repeat protein, partial [Planctomycetaceae bacterium]
LTGPLVLNLDEQHAPEVPVRVAAALRWLSAHPGWFLILDNVDSEDAAVAVEQLLPKLRDGHVLITSRLGRWHGQVQPLELDVLLPEAAAQFLLERTQPEGGPGRQRGRLVTAADATDAAALASDLDGLALALEQAAAFIVTRRKSFAQYRQQWQQGSEQVRSWHDPREMKYPQSIATTWQTTLDQLSDDERQLLYQLAWYGAEPIALRICRQDVADSAWNLPADRLETAVSNLADFSMLRWDAASDTVTVHRVVQEILRLRQPNPAAHLQTALDRLHGLQPEHSASDVRTWPEWDQLQPHATAAVHAGHQRGIAEPVAALMTELGCLLHARAQFAAAEPLLDTALTLYEKADGANHPNVATGLNNLASLLRATNRHTEAEPLYRRALSIDETSYGPNHPEVATGLNNLAELLRDTNRLSEAEPLIRRALSIDETSYGPNHPDVANGLDNLAFLLCYTNRLSEAEPLYRRALSISETSYGPHHPEVASGLKHLADLL